MGYSAPMQNTLYDDLSPIVGFTATVAILTWYAGRKLYVPTKAAEGCRLAGIIGMPALRALVREHGGEELQMPEAPGYFRLWRDREVATALATGSSVGEVAAKFGLSPRRIEQMRDEFTERGILVLLSGWRPKVGRPRAGRSPYLGLALAENLGTGEVSAEPPPP